MTLPKSLRPRRRYVFFRVETLPDARVDEDDIRRALWFEAQNLYGDATSAQTEATLVEYSGAGKGEKFGVGVVRCLHDAVDETRSALACVHDVDGAPVGVYVVGVSGTLRSGRKKYADDTPTEAVSVDGRRGWYADGVLDVEGDDDGFMCATPHDYAKDRE